MTYAYSAESTTLEPGKYFGYWYGWVVTVYVDSGNRSYDFVATLGIRGRVECEVIVSPGGGARVETRGFDFSPS